jgi:hypothetical protein
MALDPDRRALAGLFAFIDPTLSVKDRQEAAICKLDVKIDSFRHGGERKLLRDLADEMFRGELGWTSAQIEATRAEHGVATLNRWCDELEFHRSVVFSETDSGEQTWATEIVLRCVRPEIPIFVAPQKWSGSGTEETIDTVEVLSGQVESKPAKLRHRLLTIRPESDAGSGYTLYIWDLGEALRVGAEQTLSYTQRLRDSGSGTFQRFIGVGTAPHRQMRRIRLQAKAPDAHKAYIKTLELRTEVTVGAYSSQVATQVGALIPVDRDPEGFFTADITDITHGLSYELHWE